MKSMKNLSNNNWQINDNPDENMRMENEFLQLKLKAELGAETYITGNFSAEAENTFLKNVLAFEHSFSNASMKNIFELLNKPKYFPAGELDDETIELELDQLMTHLKEKQITLDFAGSYDSRTKYKFITEEFFNEQISDTMIPGMIWHFTFEEYHPNHKLDIENKAIAFIKAWIDQKITKNYQDLAETFIMPNGQIFHRDEIITKIKNMCRSFPEFKDCRYKIEKVDFELQHDGGMGFAEGFIKYNALSRNQEKIAIEGQFKFYFTLEHDRWSIFYFIFPGFEFPFAE
jgi:hypothetical protein